jgi:sulfite exporter TauE/SafE/copper chaperone CopZ
MLKKINLKIKGIHCKSCKTLIETEIDVLPGVKSVLVNHQTGMAEVEFDEEKITKEKIFAEIKKLNYEPIPLTADAADKTADNANDNGKFLTGLLIPILLFLFIGGYFLVNNFGGFELLAKLNEGNVGYGLIFIIGLLAGFHCVGMCGGLVVSYSASCLKNGETKNKFAPHFQYNLGRLISYSVIGAILGGVGSFFGINPIFTGIITVLAGFFMIIMGLSFIKNWPILEKINPAPFILRTFSKLIKLLSFFTFGKTKNYLERCGVKLKTPQFIARYLFSQKHSGKNKGPFLIGILNGFMPCGPLQAMQLYALASGSIERGFLSMFFYALGTIPLMFIFGSTISTLGKNKIDKIIKISGVLIILLGLLMFNRGLANFGYGIRLNSTPIQNNNQNNNSPEEEFQTIKMDLTYLGYQPNTLYIKKGVPVRWVINVKEMSGCTNAIMIESLGIKKNLKYGENIIEFTPPENVKEIKFSCWMRMVWGKFIVTDGDGAGAGVKEVNAADNNSAPLPSGSCGLSSGGGCGCGGGGGVDKDNSNSAVTGSCH